ncbi:MAG: MotA/TolQ/ExbB proton channel family protein [Victivallales bacterium]|nr:MotA/TolQ/ExbB proton channel family protein [Victivallales bacterium]
MTPVLNYIKTGGWLMIPIIIVAFMIWHRYFISLAALKHGCDVQLVAHEIRFMAAFVAAAPLLGLLGTVIGMMDTFHAAATDTAALASGIGKALVTTQAGLATAIPGTLALAHLRHRLKKHHA